MTPLDAHRKAMRDHMSYGVGYTIHHADGTVTHEPQSFAAHSDPTMRLLEVDHDDPGVPMTEFACNPTDFERLPWVPDCQQCTNLHTDPHPGLFTWVTAVAQHFEDEHQIALVGA